jgi:glycosyltransferase involved in cell wall biosynthesis
MAPLSILITNTTLATRTGSETVVRDLALGLAQAGHQPFVYSPQLGPIAEELRAAGITAIDKLSQSPRRPDIIHGHHHAETVAAALYFRETPAIFVCHHPMMWTDHPPKLSRIRHFVAVDVVRRDRLLSQKWMSHSDVSVIPNSVDTNGFKSRTVRLPVAPGRALLFSNYASAANYGATLIAMCGNAGLALDIIGAGFHRSAVVDAAEWHVARRPLRA